MNNGVFIMMQSLQATRALFAAWKTEIDVESLRQKFLDSYDELEVGKLSLAHVVDAAFESLADNQQPSVLLFRRAAMEIARRVDAGEDGTAQHAYHNALHFAKVVITFRALSSIHNSLYPKDEISNIDIAAGLLAATAHDLRHNGRGNTVDGKHQQFRLEQIAIDTAVEWASIQNISERSKILPALGLIYATDVSFDGVNPSPAAYVRGLHDCYFETISGPPQTPYAGVFDWALPNVNSLISAALLHDADVFSSLLEDKAHQREDGRVAAEMQLATGKARGIAGDIWFLENMLQRRTTTNVSRRFTDGFIAKQLAIYGRPSPT